MKRGLLLLVGMFITLNRNGVIGWAEKTIRQSTRRPVSWGFAGAGMQGVERREKAEIMICEFHDIMVTTY